MWIVFAVLSAFFAGITSILAKCGIKNTDSNVATALRTVVVLIFSWIIVFIVGSFSSIKTIKADSLVFLLLSGVSTGASWLCYFKALQLGPINKVVAIDKSSTVLTILLALIFLNEGLSIPKLFALCLITLGILLMIQKKESDDISKKGWFVFAVLSAVFASLTAILGKVGITGIESNLGTAIRTCVVLVMAFVMVFASKKHSELKTIDKKELLFIILSGFSTGASWLCYYKALQDGKASVVVPIDKLSVLVTVAFSYFVFKEKLDKKATIGLLLLCAGTLFMVAV